MKNLAQTNQEKLAAAMAKRVDARATLIDSMYDNENYVNVLASRAFREQNIEVLKGLYTQLEQIPVERISGIGEIRVTPYAVMPSIFGEELGLLLGLITTLSTLFIDEQKDLAYSLVSTSSSEIEDLIATLGRPSYFSKKYVTVEDAIHGDFAIAQMAIEMFANNIGLQPVDMSRFTERTYNLWFSSSEQKAKLKLEQIHKFDAVESDSRAAKLIITE